LAQPVGYRKVISNIRDPIQSSDKESLHNQDSLRLSTRIAAK